MAVGAGPVMLILRTTRPPGPPPPRGCGGRRGNPETLRANIETQTRFRRRGGGTRVAFKAVGSQTETAFVLLRAELTAAG